MIIRFRLLQRLTDQTSEKIGQRPGVVSMFRRGIPRLLKMLWMIVVALAMLHAPRLHSRRSLRVRIGRRAKQPSAELFKKTRLVSLALVRLLGLYANHNAQSQAQGNYHGEK